MAKKLTPSQRKISKQRKRIKDYIRKKEKQGYRWTDEFKERVTSFKTLKALENWNAEKLLGKSTFMSQITGDVISGLEGQKETRSLSAKRGWETRRTREYQREHFEEPIYTPPETESEVSPIDWDDWRGKYYNDESEEKGQYYDWSYDSIYEGKVILSRLRSVVDSYTPRMGAYFLESLIVAQLNEFGDNFIKALAVLDEEIVAEATTLAQYESSDREEATRQYNKMVNMIRGAMATEDEAKEVGEALDDIDDFESE